MIIILASILLVLLFTLLSAIIDSEMILKKQYIDSHKSRWCQRVCFFLVFGLYNWLWIFAAALLFTSLFDQILNQLRSKPFWYLGTVAKWDIFFSKRKWLYIIVKSLSFFGSMLLFFYG